MSHPGSGTTPYATSPGDHPPPAAAAGDDPPSVATGDHTPSVATGDHTPSAAAGDHTPSAAAGDDAQHAARQAAALDDWVGRIDAALARLQSEFLPADFPFDYSRASLGWLESELIERYPPGAGPAGDGFVTCTMTYLGEALLTAAGGSWGWGQQPGGPPTGLPLVCPDPALGLLPVSPLHLVIDAVRVRDGQVFARGYGALERAAAEHRTGEPCWSPTRPTAFATDTFDRTEALESLRGWLADQQAAFPRWVRDFSGAPELWDFSVPSLDAMQALVRRVAAGVDLDRPEYHDFVDGAVWYCGEVVSRTTGAQWELVPGDPAANHPYLESPDRGGQPIAPLSALQQAATGDDPAALRRGLGLAG